MHDTTVIGAGLVPGRLNHRHEVWKRVMLRGHPQAAQLLLYLKNGVSVFEFLNKEYGGTSPESPYRGEEFPGVLFPNRTPQAHAEFVRSEVTALVKR